MPLTAAQLEALAAGPKAVSGDAGSVTARDAEDILALNAAAAAKNARCEVVTFSGMRPDNALRHFGSLNFYVPAGDYGLVECAHTNLLHSMVSIPT